MEAGAAYIRDLVREADRDRYWSALLAPEPAQQDLLALHAFALELARIPDQVSEPHLGEVRLQWWREALQEAHAGGPADQPVLAALSAACRRHGLPEAPLQAMIDARGLDVHAERLADGDALGGYLSALNRSIFELGARILGMETAPAWTAAAVRAYGLTRLAGALPADLPRGRLFLPETLLSAHGLHPDAVLSGTDNPDIRAVLRHLLGEVEENLGEARRGFSQLPRQFRPAFLPLAPVGALARKLAAPSRNPLVELVQLNPITRFSLIWRAYVTGRI